MSNDQKEEINLPADLQEAFDLICQGIEEVLPANELKKKLLKSKESGKTLIVKAGFDPTAPDLHLGHTVLLQKLRVFQDLGHEVNFLVGDYTAMIGDPTGKSETRKPLSEEQILENAKTYTDQVFKVLDHKKTKVVFNSKWLRSLDLKAIIELTAKYTVARLIERDDFNKRYKAGQPISLVEFMYPLMQGYDSVAMFADVELGGTDQKFNLLVGRDLQSQYGQEPQCIITLPLLVGLDGEKKMSKSLNNYIGIQEEPIEIFGKVMSLSDELMWNYYLLVTDLNAEQVENLKNQVAQGNIHPKEAKAKLGLSLISRYYTKEEADEAQQEWERIHAPSQRGLPDEIDTYTPIEDLMQDGALGLLNALSRSGMVKSNGEARRMVQSGGVHQVQLEGDNLVENTIKDHSLTLGPGEYIFRLGKRKFIKVLIPE